MLGQHLIFVVSVAAVVAPLLASTHEGPRVPVVVTAVLPGVPIGPQVMRLTEFESFMSVSTPRTTRRAIFCKVSHCGAKSIVPGSGEVLGDAVVDVLGEIADLLDGPSGQDPVGPPCDADQVGEGPVGNFTR